ncbi:MAG: hypothetical protein JSU69_07100 [Candidatus Zixiibacteriota bacterium]|nr:MAG: hypothetical protein JSU69_07100 [candidate division Zixibacteria bacterium]
MPENQRLIRMVAVALGLLVSLALAALAENRMPELWGSMEPGRYGIGFRTIEEFDYSRTFGPKYDYDGELREGIRARPIQICLWYPANVKSDDSRMVYSEYNYPYPKDERFIDFLNNVQGRELQVLLGIIRSRGAVQDFLNIKMAAVKDAEWAEGSFPLIIYHPHTQTGVSENAPLCEYLASHGFIVATSPPVGTLTLNPEINLADLETMVRDREFVYARARDLPHVDTNRLGAMGTAFGGVTSLVMQTRNSNVDAVAGLQSLYVFNEFYEPVKDNPYLEKNKVLAPLMLVYNDGESPADLSLFDSFDYSQRYLLKLSRLTSRDFSQYGLISIAGADSAGPTAEERGWDYDTMARYLLNFFKAHLYKDEASFRYLSANPTAHGLNPEFVNMSISPAGDRPPTEEEFIRIIDKNGVDRAVEIFEKFRKSDPELTFFQEAVMNALGYQRLQSYDIDAAAKLFKMNTESYPNSANVWDSYAEACQARGDTALVISCLKKTLEILPNDTAITDQFRQLIRNHAEQVLRDYGELE